MKPSNEQLLISIRDTLAERVRPLLPPKQSLDLLHSIGLALDELLDREGEQRQHYRDACKRTLQLAARANELTRAIDGNARQSASAGLPELPNSYEQLATLLDDTRQQLASVIPALGSIAGDAGVDGKLRASARELLMDVLREDAQQARTRPASPVPSRPRGESDDALLAKLTVYLKRRLDAGADFKVVSISRPSHGFSRETLIVRIADAAGTRDLVFRIEKPMGNLRGVGRDVAQEYAVMSVLSSTSLPLPRPLWIELDASLLDGRFIVMERVAGENFGSYFSADRAIGRGLLKQFAESLATLHAFAWEAHRDALAVIGVCEIHSVRDAVSQQLDRWCAYWREAQLSPAPAIDVLHDWLRRKIPAGARAVLDHGDLGFHNMLCQGEQITALLDWELVALSSPAKALAEVRDVVCRHVAWEEFIGWYVAAGGEAPSEVELHYFRVMRFFIGFIGTGNALERAFLSSVSHNIEYLELGLGARGYYHRLAAAQTDLLWPESQ